MLNELLKLALFVCLCICLFIALGSLINSRCKTIYHYIFNGTNISQTFKLFFLIKMSCIVFINFFHAGVK